MNPTIVARLRRARTLRGLAVLAIAAIAPGFTRAEPYVADPGFNNGRFYTDAFAGAPDFRAGKKIVKADNGDVIVAGIVPPVSGDAANGAIGLVRYDATGVRRPWSNAGDNGHFDDQYVVYPCPGTSRCRDVKDLKLFGSRLYVLVDSDRWRLTAQPPFGLRFYGYGSDVFVFGTDGSYQNATAIDGEPAADPDDFRTVAGGGIALYDNMAFPTVTSLVYAGTGFTDGAGPHRPRFGKFTVDGDGSLTTDTAIMEPNPGNQCPASAPCELLDVALGGRSGTSPPRIYLSGSKWHPGPPPGTIGWDAGWDYFVMNVNSSGTPGSNLYDGWVSTEGIGSESGGRGIAVKPGFLSGSDEIFVMANVVQRCKGGIAVIKHGQDGTFATDFGSAGRVRYGGSDEGDGQVCDPNYMVGAIRADWPTDIAYADGKIGVVGLNIYGAGRCDEDPCPEDNVDGELAVIDATNGAIESWRGYAYSDTPGGARSRHNGFWGVVASADGTFTATGDVRRFESAPAGQRYTQEYATLRLAAQGDRIFANGFDGVP